MKIIGIALLIGLLAISINCSTTENGFESDATGNTSQEDDSLELARKNRVDSVSRVTMPSTVNKTNTFRRPKNQ